MASMPQSSDNPWGDLPPESTEFGFPLYLNLTEYYAEYDEWQREPDDISEALAQWCCDNLIGSMTEGYVPLTEDTKIYINGGLVDEIKMEFGGCEMYGENLPFENATLGMDGWLYGYGAKFPSSGGIETTLQFPLYIYFDECDETWFIKTCYAEGDFSELASYLKDCAFAYGEKSDYAYILSGERLSKIGEIYIEDEPLTSVYCYENYEFYAEYTTENYSGQILAHEVNGELSSL